MAIMEVRGELQEILEMNVEFAKCLQFYFVPKEEEKERRMWNLKFIFLGELHEYFDT